MDVLVTGGTGFVGSHATEALLAAGHRVRVMARRPAKVAEVLGARGIHPTEVVAGDMTDAAAVRDALRGCDAVLHAAAQVGVARGGTAATGGNVDGTRHVVGQAVEVGCDPILYTSSVAVLYPPSTDRVGVDSPLGTPLSEYGRSKVEAERFVRGLQADGAPVVSLMIGGVYGPDQPELDSAMMSIVAAASQAMVVTRGGVAVLDVRDLARVVVAALEPGRGPRTYLVGGRFLTWAEWVEVLDGVLGRRCRRVRVPASMMLGLGRALDAVKRVRSFDYPLTYEAAIYMTSGVPAEDPRVADELGVVYRPTAETLADSTRWLVQAGHLDPTYAPALAAP